VAQMIYLESPSTDPYFNLALEEYIFEKPDHSKQYFMLWQNNNAIVVGKYQNTAEEINQEYVDAHDIKVVRRLSGGGAVYHDTGNLNFTFIVNNDANRDFNFRVFILPLIKTLEDLGIRAEFKGRNDVTINGQKFSGNSQYIKNDRLLHHGCIMLDSDLNTVVNALKIKPIKFESKSIKSVKSRVTTINANLSEPVGMDDFKQLLKTHIFRIDAPEVGELTAIDYAEIEKIKAARYNTWEWNFGFKADYNVKKEKRYPFGLVSVYLQSNHGYIRHIRFYGDFFGNGNISELENALIGARIDRSLRERINTLNVGNFINGMIENDMFELLVY
jgi:lipoate-protein ligase A